MCLLYWFYCSKIAFKQLLREVAVKYCVLRITQLFDYCTVAGVKPNLASSLFIIWEVDPKTEFTLFIREGETITKGAVKKRQTSFSSKETDMLISEGISTRQQNIEL